MKDAIDRSFGLEARATTSVMIWSFFLAHRIHSIMRFTIEFEREEDGRWLAEISELAGVMAYGVTPDEAIAHTKALALRVLADQIDEGERQPLSDIHFVTH